MAVHIDGEDCPLAEAERDGHKTQRPRCQLLLLAPRCAESSESQDSSTCSSQVGAEGFRIKIVQRETSDGLHAGLVMAAKMTYKNKE